MNRYRLFSHFAAINIAGIGFLVLAYLNGWIDRVITADSSYVSFVILGLFAFALLSAGWRVLHISNELDRLHDHGDRGQIPDTLKSDNHAARALEIRLFSRISHIRTIGNGLVVLGLIGTVIGFILVAAEVDGERAADVGQVGSLVGALLHGMGVAFYTTLTGAIFSLWLSLNYQILHTGTANLLAALLDRSGSIRQSAA
jgi:hypothetical protein